ncbi:MAG: alpha-amylase family protein [Candidatus Margulisiibacteriota bacterium]
MTFPFGVTYYPDQWPKDTWDKTFAEIKKAGFNLVRFGEMAWDWIEPQPGKFHFADLDHAMNLCAKHGIKVLLGIPTSQVPPWFHRKYKNSRPVAQDGTLYPDYGPRPNICKDNIYYRKHAENMAKKLVAHYKNHPALFMWQVDNEPVYPPLDHTTSNDFCHCEHSRKAFVAWSKKKYGSLKKINEVWGAKFWTNTFSSFEDITTPKAGIWEAVSPHIFLDWFRFKSDSIKDWVSHLAKIVKHIDPRHKVGTNGFIGICTRVPQHDLIPENLDWYGLDIYPTGNHMKEADYAFALDLWRSFTRGTRAEFHITELQGGQNVRWGNPAYVEGPEMKKWTEMALDHGAKCLLFHAWRPPFFGAETGGFGILQQDGSSTKRLDAVKEIAEKIEDRKSKVASRKSKIGIAYLRSSEVQSYQEQGPPRGIAGQWEAVRTDIGLMHTLLSIQGAYQAIYKDKQSVDFIFERDLESGNLPCKILLLPNAYLLSRKQFGHLKKWLEAGGVLITDARFGLKDENGHLYENPLLEDLLDVKYEHTAPIPEGFYDQIIGKPKKLQIISRKLGQGKVHYANFSLFLELKKGTPKWLKAIKPLIK